MSSQAEKHVVIVGAGFGGLKAAQELAGSPVRVTVVDRQNHHLFQPLLYQVATAGLAPGSIAVPIRGVLSKQDNARVVLGEVVGVDTDRREVALRDGTHLEYDWLILACGAKTSWFGNDQWAEHAWGLKNLRDALSIRERVLLAFEAAEREPDAATRRKLLTFVVIGAGPTGVEMAGAISELGRQVLVGDYRNIHPEDIRVLLVEMADRVLTPFEEELSHSAQRQLEDLDVEVRLSTRVEDVDADGVRLSPVDAEDGAEERVDASVVVWAAGVRAVSLPEEIGFTVDWGGRVLVDETCGVLGHPDVFAIGDVACFVPEGEEDPLPGVAPVAIQQGEHVAKQIGREVRRLPRQRFEYFDKGMMATVGRSRAVVQGPFQLTGFLAWLAWCFVHVLYLVGFRNRFIVIFNWFWSYVTFKRGARLITSRWHDGEVPAELQPTSGPSPLEPQPAEPAAEPASEPVAARP